MTLLLDELKTSGLAAQLPHDPQLTSELHLKRIYETWETLILINNSFLRILTMTTYCEEKECRITRRIIAQR